MKLVKKSPGAWIVNPSDKGRKSIKNGKVYLNDKDEFQIELFNPLKVIVLADIKLNGNSISSSGLVIRPGERFYLDCFIEDKKKFIFSTYEVGVDDVESISDNGKLEVFFYKESVVSIKNWKDKFNEVIIKRYSTYLPYLPYPLYHKNPYIDHYPNLYPTYPSQYPNYYYTTTDTNGIVGGMGTVNTSSGLLNVGSSSSGMGTVNTTTGTVNTNYTNNISASSYSTNSNNSLETGRIEKGSESSQSFTKVELDFDDNYITSIIIDILPESRRPIDTKDLIKDTKEPKSKNSELVDLIKKLSDLHKAGILTDDEFNIKKKELLLNIN